MTTIAATLTDEKYLNLFKINTNKYLIGIYQDGITVYKQQVRALNIFYALYNTQLKSQKDSNYTIGIIGGGIAGLTFAAAALQSGFKVMLFEKKSIYLHMQFGCEIRKIHPNLYEWPDKSFSNPYAGLPLLDWKYDSAANLVKKIMAEWEQIHKKAKPGGKRPGNLFSEKLSCTKITITKIKVGKKSRFQLEYENENQTAPGLCDLLILATGYGVERGVNEEADTPSYWRNDHYGQIELYAVKKTYIVSGVGDGGLIDLFRLKIMDFNYEKILKIIETGTNYKSLLADLILIKEELYSAEQVSPRVLFDRFDSLGEGAYKYIFDALSNQGLIRDTVIWLNDLSANFEETLDYKKLSFLHAFLIFVLMQFRNKINLHYHGGELKWDKPTQQYTLNNASLPQPNHVIIRHGTDRAGSLPAEFINGSSDVTLKAIKKRQEKVYNNGQVERRWSNADLSAIFNRDTSRRYEYLNSETKVLCTNYVSAIANVLKNTGPRKPFRVALYRLLYVQGNYYFQQITSYFGSRHTESNQSNGQVFPIERGNVGISFKSGHPTLIINKSDSDFEALMQAMGLNGELEQIKKNKSFMTLPILARVNGEDSQLATNLVLYIDSTGDSFFTQQPGKDNPVLLICAATAGFIEAIDHHIGFKELTMVDVDFEPQLISNELPEYLVKSACFKDICNDYPDLRPHVTRMKLKDYYSFTPFSN